ncbi:MAG: type II secretion system protein [Desulfobacteraceae bacterium]|nr:type II secretion system protein [Desulfobacteraceae bacterium]MBC2754926.1 type II secretion system protein [Desulfobacteraceae bacterium]
MNIFRHPLKLIARSKGFTLIETLVAVMILSISLVVVMQLFSGGLKSNKISNDYSYGIFHAREKMEELLLTEELLPGSFSGDFDDGYQWQAVIDFIGEEDGVSEKMPVSTMSILLDISWQIGNREKHYNLSTTVLTEKRETDETPE